MLNLKYDGRKNRITLSVHPPWKCRDLRENAIRKDYINIRFDMKCRYHGAR